MFQQFGNWSDALAAYNAGPTRINSDDPWPSETVNYVSSILGKVTGVASSVAQTVTGAVSGGAWTPGEVDLGTDTQVVGVNWMLVGVAAVGLGAAWLWFRE